MRPPAINNALTVRNVDRPVGARQQCRLPICGVCSTAAQWAAASFGSNPGARYVLWQPPQNSAAYQQQQLLLHEQQQCWNQLTQLQRQQKQLLPSELQMPQLAPARQQVEQLEQTRQQMPQLQASQELYWSMLRLCPSYQLQWAQLRERQWMQVGHLLQWHELARRDQYRQCPQLIPVQWQQSIQMEQRFSLQRHHLIEQHWLEWQKLSELGSEQSCHLYPPLAERQRDQIIQLDIGHLLKLQELYSMHAKQGGSATPEMSDVAKRLGDYSHGAAIQ